ncbi:ATP-dependent DNA helicase RecG [Jatrophihabitans cynanchi]|uniref:Probable DNA 3'-5' helicase RecG n=1 Tax=Jatrophihabitans cynanchi TaxID=2944128 RepID=A0ABY7K0V3_9ACTN|nr:ATP-dependent DNA helicase RecG [Jatrophihabitans sp. SB3-54]WAX57815.1 ATP-dependent DNA helicase RecG [Jatrophihabitans sp. SB3-54]
MADLNTPLSAILGSRTTKPLEKAFEIRTIGDLLRHYPRRMDERGELTDLASLRVDEDVTVMAEVRSCVERDYRNQSTGRRDVRIEATVSDGRGSLQLVFFGGRNRWRTRDLVPGTLGLFSGKVGEFRSRRQLIHPDYMILQSTDMAMQEADVFARRLIAVYPATKDVRSWTIANSVGIALDSLGHITDPLPDELRARHGLMGLDAAIRAMHQPDDRDQWFAARRRLKWDEALLVQLVLAQRRARAAANPATPRPPRAGGVLDAFDARLPFTLTAGQREVGAVLSEEIAAAHPMHRLLQGEVGSGKTVVALRAMLQVVDAGGQAALLAPTEVLAAQHARTIEELLGPLARAGQLGGADVGTRVALLTGSLGAAARKSALLDAAGGAAGIVVGTHALIQEQVQFAELGLVVVDEQHRFGVEQRDALRGKAERPPHVLVMTATPIPRTVAMTVFGDLDTSTLAELPAGRAPISTAVVPVAERPTWLERAWARVREEVAAGHQAFVVCPRIGADLSETEAELDAELGPFADEPRQRRPPLAVLDIAPMLVEGPLAGLRLGVLHGRLLPDEKDRVMGDFAAGRLDVLVATTVVEVGVDVPNATVMAVLDAERFGVSQLHQLRGRIGRGSAPGVCLLVTEAGEGSPSRARLDAIAATTDGFALARLDVEQRREGDVLGAAQSGRRSQLRLLSLLRDEDLIVAARAEASELVARDPELSAFPALAAELAVLQADERTSYLDKA